MCKVELRLGGAQEIMTELNPVDVLRMAFPELSELALAPLASLTRQQTYSAGALICREGEFADKFYIIGAGEVEFTKQFTDDEERRLRTGQAGVYFGEMALVQGTMRSANVRTLTEVTVLEIGKDAFQEAIQTNPAMMLDIMRTLVERMRANDAAALEEMRQQKEAIEAAYEELRHQERLRTEFLTTLAHELRTPLTSSSGYMQLVQSGAMTGPAQTMALQKIGTNLDRIVSLVNDLLFVQEQDLIEPNLRPVSLLALIEVVIDDLREEADDQGCVITVQIPPDLPTLQADPDGLVRAFHKLLENAIKFSPEGGDITITARSRGAWVDVDFIDRGLGITESFMPRLFERFERIDQIGVHVFKGIGLGLSIAKHIIESHGGSITVESTPGAGSTFSVHLRVDGGRPQLGATGGEEKNNAGPAVVPVQKTPPGDPWEDATGDETLSSA
jgi:signal transduction histidine kinase